jgi:predicted GNAT family N-acyltransferase
MTYHNNFLDKRSRDLVIFKEYNNNDEINQSSVVDLGRLIIKSEFRSKGIAQYLNKLRIHIAKLLNTEYMIVTASQGNTILLKKLGFIEINKIVYFDDRPNYPFHCLQLKI